jgi:hypothetical protein
MVRVDVNNSAANTAVFMDASLLSWIRLLTGDAARTLSAGGNARKISQADAALDLLPPLPLGTNAAHH